MAFAEPLEHYAVLAPKRNFLKIGSDPSHLRTRVGDQCSAMTRNLRSEAFTVRNEVFVTTTTEAVSI